MGPARGLSRLNTNRSFYIFNSEFALLVYNRSSVRSRRRIHGCLQELLDLRRSRRPFEGTRDSQPAPLSHRLLGCPRRDLLASIAAKRSASSGKTDPARARCCRSAPEFSNPPADVANVQGRVAALLELGSGFNPEFSGRDNVYLNGAILGLSTKDMDSRFAEIEAFAEIGDFINQPVKTYSSGMAVRLAFAVAIHLDPEILLVDEALSVGDVYFRPRCMRKVHELRKRGVTILFVSHSTGDVKAIGDRAMWLDHGRIRAIGKTDLVVSQYLGRDGKKDAQYLAHEGELGHRDQHHPAEIHRGHPQYRPSLRRWTRADSRHRGLRRIRAQA